MLLTEEFMETFNVHHGDVDDVVPEMLQKLDPVLEDHEKVELSEEAELFLHNMRPLFERLCIRLIKAAPEGWRFSDRDSLHFERR